LREKLPASVRERLDAGARGELPETPKLGNPALSCARHVILASNRLSLEAARNRASALGFEAEIFRADMVGDTHAVARDFARRLKELAAERARPSALLAGGELTLVVKGKGRGGRNQELALACALHLQGVSGLTVLAAGTDGTDGPTDAAGAFSDGSTWERARGMGLDPEAFLADNDSYRLFDRLGDLLKTGPTGTNVNDLLVGLVSPQRATSWASA
jgi:glycerate-2-kinase